MAEFKLPKINNGFSMTKEEYDEFIKFQRIVKFQMQEINDNLSGGLTSRNLASFRNTYIINSQDSLDASYPMYVHFNIISEMIKIVSVKVSFWILNYRAYSVAAKSGGAATSGATGSASGGGATSGATGSASGGGATSGALTLGGEILSCGPVNTVIDTDGTGYRILSFEAFLGLATHTHSTPNHTHPNHTHSTPNHTHPNHTHSTPNHTHDIDYGIFEEETSPTIKFYVSENEGVSYNDTFFGGYDKNKADLEITSLLTSSGSKLIKFTSDLRARLSVQIEIKLDIKAR